MKRDRNGRQHKLRQSQAPLPPLEETQLTDPIGVTVDGVAYVDHTLPPHAKARALPRGY